MRRSLLGLLGMIALVHTAGAQGYPDYFWITAPQGVDVKSGPTTKYYVTNRLPYGARVLVVKKSEQDGWLAIKPPPDSFSWINEKDIKQLDANTGIVDSDNATVRVGSIEDNRSPDAISPHVPRGEIVIIKEKARTTESGNWLKIMPCSVELRFIPHEAIESRDTRFASTSKTAPSVAPGHPAGTTPSANWAPTQLASLSQPVPAQPKLISPPMWSPAGILQRGADKDGQPTYYIKDARNSVLMYVVCQPGFTLRDYVGKTVALYGPTSYQSEDRKTYMTATHLYPY